MNTANEPKLGAEGSILEGIVTTRNADGSVNLAPMGPIVDPTFATWIFRPFRSSTTYQNLKRQPSGVFHVTDDVLLIAQAAVGKTEPPPTFTVHHPLVLSNCCRWFDFDVETLDDSEERTHIVARTTHSERLRDFFGFNRAKHAVLEAAILATRLHILPLGEVLQQMLHLQTIVDKTGSEDEHHAFSFLQGFVANATSSASAKERVAP